MWSKILPSAAKVSLLFFLLISTRTSFSQPDVEYLAFIGASANLEAPMELADAPGDAADRFFIVEKAGIIKIRTASGINATPFLDITGIVEDAGEQGLLSMAFHTQYQTNGYFYVYYNNNAGNIVVARYTVSSDPDIADPLADPPSTLINIPKNNTNHNGGHLQFKVEAGDPYLYFATGDGGGGNDPDRNAQNYASYLGKLIRINVDVQPFIPEIRAWGLRNPFRWSFDRTTGDIWIGDVGQSSREEINFSASGFNGVNYGWPCVEGTENNASAPSNSQCDTVTPVDILPIFDYDNPTDGESVVGGYVYRGSAYPSMQGYYYATDFYSGNLWSIRPQDPGPGWDISVKPNMATGISSISESLDGRLFAISLYTGEILELGIAIVTALNLVSFSGKALLGYNELKWVAESEQDIDRYYIEHSTDGRNFTAAGNLVSLNDGNRNTYTFRHQLSNSGLVYYRLRITETDGSFKYSPVITVGNTDNRMIKLYPTIITGSQVNLITDIPVNTIQLVNMDGRVLLNKNMNGAEGYISLTIPALPKGTYFIRIVTSEKTKTEKIVVQ